MKAPAYAALNRTHPQSADNKLLRTTFGNEKLATFNELFGAERLDSGCLPNEFADT